MIFACSDFRICLDLSLRGTCFLTSNKLGHTRRDRCRGHQDLYKKMKNRSMFHISAVLMVALTFSMPLTILAQQKSVQTEISVILEIKAAAERDASSDINRFAWFTAGLGIAYVGGGVGGLAGCLIGETHDIVPAYLNYGLAPIRARHLDLLLVPQQVSYSQSFRFIPLQCMCRLGVSPGNHSNMLNCTPMPIRRKCDRLKQNGQQRGLPLDAHHRRLFVY